MKDKIQQRKHPLSPNDKMKQKKNDNKQFIFRHDLKNNEIYSRKLLHNSNKPTTFASQFRGIAVKKEILVR